MKSPSLRLTFLVFMVCAGCLMLGGCAGSLTDQAATLRDDTVIRADQIDAAVNQAAIDAADADAAVMAASTAFVPTTQPASQVVKSSLATAHAKIVSVKKDLAPVPDSATKIKSNAVDQASLTSASETKNAQLESQWLSPRMKAAGIVLIVVILLGVFVFFFLKNSSEFSPVLEVIQDLFTGAMKFVGHVLTLGTAWIGAKLGTAVKAKVAAKQPPAT